MSNDRMIEFRLKGPMNNRLPNVGKSMPGETCYLRVGMILCLFPEHCQIRTVENGWTLEVFEEDFPKVERAFRSMFLGGRVHAVDVESLEQASGPRAPQGKEGEQG